MKKIRHSRAKSLLKKIGREMQVPSFQYPCDIEIFETHLCHDPRISKNESLLRLRKNDGQACLLPRKSSNDRYVHAALGETFETQFAERIFADGGMEGGTIPEEREVVRKNRRRASERDA